MKCPLLLFQQFSLNGIASLFAQIPATHADAIAKMSAAEPGFDRIFKMGIHIVHGLEFELNSAVVVVHSNHVKHRFPFIFQIRGISIRVYFYRPRDLHRLQTSHDGLTFFRDTVLPHRVQKCGVTPPEHD